MDDDSTFRLLLLVLALVTMPVGLYHRIRAETGERIDRWQEGVVILIGLRLSGLVLFVAGIAWMISPPFMAWSALAIPLWRGVDYVQENGLRGHTFASLHAQNEHLQQWERKVADTRIHGTTKQHVGKLFETVERAALRPLPAERFPFYEE